MSRRMPAARMANPRPGASSTLEGDRIAPKRATGQRNSGMTWRPRSSTVSVSGKSAGQATTPRGRGARRRGSSRRPAPASRPGCRPARSRTAHPRTSATRRRRSPARARGRTPRVTRSRDLVHRTADRRAVSSSTSALCCHSSGLPPKLERSACCATTRTVSCSPPPPIQIGGCGCCSGFGSHCAPSTVYQRPSYDASALLHISFTISTVSRSRPSARAARGSSPG